MSTNDGGPAFPVPFVYDPDRGECGAYVDGKDADAPTGMSLRDWLTGQALAGMLAYPNGTGNAAHYAKCAVEMADATIAALKQNRASP